MKRNTAFLGAMLLASLAAAGPAEIDPRIFASAAEGERASFLVLLREQADLSGAAAIRDPAERRRFVFEALRGVAERTQAPILETLRGSGAVVRPHYLVNFVEVEGERSLASELAARPEVFRLAANRPSRLERRPEVVEAEGLAAEPAGPLASATVGANLTVIGAPDLWARGITGQGIVIGNADTGFEWEHPALKPKYRGFDGTAASHDYNWHDAIHDARAGNPCGSNSAAPCDDQGHGTATSGLAVGDDGAGNQVGVAPGAKLIGCRNMDHGNGTPARYTECFEFLLAPTDALGDHPRPELGADVVNNSWGCPPSEGCTDPNILLGVVQNVRAAGVFVVVSAGNGGPDCSTILDAPAIYDVSFSVAATDNSDVIASFSSRGPVTVDGSNRLKPDIAAPGVNVRSAALGGLFSSFFSGTSASGPHVSGAVALLWSAVPSLRGDVATTEEILKASAAPLLSTQTCGDFPGDAVPNAVFGFGRLDGVAAVDLAGPPPPPERVVRPVPRRQPPHTRRVLPRTR